MARRLVVKLIRGEKGNEGLLVKLVSVSESQSGPGSNSLRATDWNIDADSDPDPGRTIRSNRAAMAPVNKACYCIRAQGQMKARVPSHPDRAGVSD